MSSPKRLCGERPEVHEEPIAVDLINNLNDDCLGTIFRFLPLRDKFKITEVCKRWQDLSGRAWENIKSLTFGKFRPDIPWMARSTHLQELPLEVEAEEGIERVLKKCGHYLEKLYLTTEMDGRILPVIAGHCPNLKVLQIECHYRHWEMDIFFPKLQSLEMTGPLYGWRAPAGLLQALPPTMTDLTLEAVRDDIKPAEFLRNVALPAFESFTKLSQINLTSFFLDYDIMNVITQKSSLKRIYLGGWSEIAGMPPLTSLTNLQYLEFGHHVEIEESTLIEISETCQELKSLKFYSDTVTDRGVSSLSLLTKLEVLSMGRNHNVTDAPFRSLHSLTRLVLRGCRRVGDEGIITLIKYASNLEFLTLVDTGVTQKLLHEANEIMKQRTNNIPLNLRVSSLVIEGNWFIDGTSPLLIVP